MACSTIIGGNILDGLWPEIVLAMVHVKNLRLTSPLGGKTPYELMEKKSYHWPPTSFRIHYLCIYSQNQLKRQNSKAAKFAFKAQRDKLVEYNKKAIY